jgi:hypothetical protein
MSYFRIGMLRLSRNPKRRVTELQLVASIVFLILGGNIESRSTARRNFLTFCASFVESGAAGSSGAGATV